MLVVHAEDKSAAALAAKRIKQNSVVMTDELGAYADFKDLFIHKAVNHTFEFSTLSGVNTNQAESYFSRLRRFEFGQIHKLPPTYMLAYVNEIAWREDMRREKATNHLADVLGKALRSGFSSFAGYYQNYLWKRMAAAAAKAGATPAVKAPLLLPNPPLLLPAPGGITGP